MTGPSQGAEPSAGRATVVWRAATVAVCVAGGVLIGVSRSAATRHLPATRSVDLSALVDRAQQRAAADGRSAAALQSAIDELAAGQPAGPGSGPIAVARARAARLRPAAALTPVVGPGLRVTLDDAPRQADGSYPAGATPDDLVIHQQDVQSVVNALWAGGAEAMMIMDQRVIATSAVRCIGSTLLLQGRTYSPPFVVSAIGDSAAMLGRLAAEPGVALLQQYVDRFHVVLATEPLDRVQLPAYSGVIRLTAARATK